VLVKVNGRTPSLRRMRQLFPRKLPVPGNPALSAGRAAVSSWGKSDPLRAVLKAAGPIKYDGGFRALCRAIERWRDLAGPLDLRNDLSPQKRAERYRRAADFMAKAQVEIEAVPPDQAFDDLVAAVEAIEGEDADADAIVRDRRPWFDQIPAMGAMLLKTAELAEGEPPRSRGRNTALPLGLIDDILRTWRYILHRPIRPGRVGSPLGRFVAACCTLHGLDVSAKAIRPTTRRSGHK
jgi:hypothetical protein